MGNVGLVKDELSGARSKKILRIVHEKVTLSPFYAVCPIAQFIATPRLYSSVTVEGDEI